jgi:hypothetical protein
MSRANAPAQSFQATLSGFGFPFLIESDEFHTGNGPGEIETPRGVVVHLDTVLPGKQPEGPNARRELMSKKPYETPKVVELGSVKELTETTPENDKCSGSGDVRTVQELSPNYSTDCP